MPRLRPHPPLSSLLPLPFSLLLLAACGVAPRIDAPADSTPPSIPYVVELRESDLQIDRPFVHSAALAVRGDKWLIIGGRVDGFHGRTEAQHAFPTTRANDSLWVVDAAGGASWGVPLPSAYAATFSATNAQYLQDGNALYVVGGFAAASPSDPQFNTTLDTFTAIEVDAMIEAVMSGSDPSGSVLYSLSDTLFKVTGGGLVQLGDSFYLVMGQSYDTVYSPGVNGRYTLQIRQFSTDGSSVTLEGVYTDERYPADSVSRFRRRDLNVVPAIRAGREAVTIYGGAFTVPDDDGWTQPVYIDLDGSGATQVRVDTTFDQTTNQYDAAQVLVYDASAGVTYTSLLGGIGAYQYDASSNAMVYGDNGAKLPFVDVITTIADAGGRSTAEFIQSPLTGAPVMPGLLGTNAYFIPDYSLLYGPGILDYDSLADSATYVGKFFGGIRATAPTSSSMNPTSVNRTIYDVYLRKR